MKIKKFLFPAMLVGTALALTHRAFTKNAPLKPVFKSGSVDAIDAFIEQQMARLSIPGAALAIVEGDKIVHLRGFGRSGPGSKAPSPQTPFALGSITKSFTALAVMQLVEAGKIELDAPVQYYLPWFRVADPQASAQMTVRHLLNQTSGLPSSCGWIPLADFDDRPGANERHARALSTLELTRPVGSAFEYSNMNYDLLGLILEAASGVSYVDYVQNHIFNPLGMGHSYTSKTKAKQDGLAVGHRFWFWSPLAAPNLPVPAGSIASGQLISSAEDMARYLIAYLNEGRCGSGQILSRAGVEEMQRGATEFRIIGNPIGEYGMGWFATVTGQTKTIWHSGCEPDYSSYMALLPEQKKGVILLVNAGHFMMEPVMSELGMDVAALLAGKQAELNKFGFKISRMAPWAMGLLLLIPLLQIAGVAATCGRLLRWQKDPQRRPSRGRMWGEHILLPLIPNLSLAVVPILLQASRMRGFFSLFAPDFSWIALMCGGFAGIWAILRTGLILRALRKAA